MPAHKRKPNYNGATTMEELLTAVCDYYGDPVDDRKSEDPDHVSLHDVADLLVRFCGHKPNLPENTRPKSGWNTLISCS